MARVQGLEGRARVCARRAAGAAVREFFELRGLPLPGPSAVDLLEALRELPGWATMLAMGIATAGVVLLSLPPKARADRSAWTGAAAWYGLASGAGFALSAVGYRGAALQLPEVSAWPTTRTRVGRPDLA